MERALQILLLFLFGLMEFSCCENSFDLSIPNQKLEDKTTTPGKIDAQISDNASDDDKIQNKKRSFYDRNNDRNSEYSYMAYGNNKKNQYDNEGNGKNYGSQESYGWNNGKSKMSYNPNSRMDDFANVDDKYSRGPHGGNPRMNDRYNSQWENNGDYNYNSGGINRMNDARELNYRSNSYSEDMGMFNHEGNRRMPPNHYNGYRESKQNDFNTNKEMVSTMLPRYDVPASMDYPLTGGFAGEGHEFCKPEKAIIINLKADCPLGKQGRHGLLQKYLYPSKPHLHQYFPPEEVDPSFYYL